MARQVSVSIDNNFSKGLVTEASGMTFPENSCTVTLDCVHQPTGNVERRLGYDFEINHSLRNISKTDGVVVSYLWKDVDGDGELSLLVKQVRNTLVFYDASTTEPLSSQAISDSINLNSFDPTGDAPEPRTRECQFTSGNGRLFVVHPYLNPFSVEFDKNTRLFTTTDIEIQVRDFEGLEDNLAVTTRPQGSKGSMSTAHHYNLLNQGWDETHLTTWDGHHPNMPSNVDVMWRFKNYLDEYTLNETDHVTQGNSPAPKGHFILDVFNKDREDVSDLNIDIESTDFQRPSTVSFFAGRVFYAGTNFVDFNSKIFFTQIIESDKQFGKCHQVNDPTSEGTFDLLPSDGGVIDIQEAGTIFKMLSLPGGLVAFASNGVWLISGSTGIGFTANDYTVTKLSSISSISNTSFIDLAGSPVWWNIEGIYKLEGSGGQGFQVTSLTEQTIKSYYATIPPSEKRSARGYFNPLDGSVQWLFRNIESTSIEEFYEYNRILNLDTSTGAFYIWTIPDHNVKVHGIVVIENRGGVANLENVFDNSGNVVTSGGEDVQVWTISDSIVTPIYKYIVSYSDGGDRFTFAEARRDDYTDWVLEGDPVDYTSTFTTGYRLRGNAMTDFQSNYVTFYSDNDSMYSVQGVWDYSNVSGSGRWTVPQIIDAQGEDNYDVVIKRRKIRGSGKSIQIKADSVTGQPFNIIGWAMMTSANQTP